MNKNLLLSLLLLFSVSLTFAQTTATDFTAHDCDGQLHHLFAELEAGKVIVIAWVMPCAACLPPSLAAFNAVKSYTDDYPGVVSFYLVDDFGDTPCNTLKSWASANGLPKSNTFSDATIKMSDYGQNGMPKVVVLGGGADHKIFYNQNNLTTGIGEAIAEALSTTSTYSVREDLQLRLFPNPTPDELQVSYTLPGSTVVSAEVLDLRGAEVLPVLKDEQQPAGAHDLLVDLRDLSEGVYFFRLNTENDSKVVRFFISK